ncbi:Holliday junction resolvase RecU [Fervidibacillus halotolerans]|uniref:Holliday junction resolvase RecU n=1 Tax=Fervidibacillus halotolerans TaxID=2980027 RepID=A0A9E8M1W2_9BACI|nr:Holliday junction resolvase RecU [Fervidibacillus halotolerans]WAA13729.1 Holliday junction resolvase RecU [Fervidibacillus halotolerans]
MDIRYPGGKKYQVPKLETSGQKDYGNRGMTFEEDINESNKYYLANGIAVIHKKPTPIQIVEVDYPKRSAAKIKEAYFKTPSTTDYNGVYKGRYIDFEAKETKNKTSFPLKNFHEHQVIHMKNIIRCGGISFVLIRFSTTDEVYFLDGNMLLKFWERMKAGRRKSIKKEEIVQFGYSIPIGFRPRIDYIRVIDSIYKEFF